MKTARLFLVGFVIGGTFVGRPNTLFAADDGQIGFIVNNEFSSFLSVNGEIAFDFFAPLRDLPGFNGFINLNSRFLQQSGFFSLSVFAPPTFGILAKFANINEETDSFKLVFNPDPFIIYELNLENTTDEPMTIQFSVSPPIVPVVGNTNVISQLNVNLIDRNNDGTVFIDAGGATLQDFFLVDDSGILQNAGVDLGGDINTEGLSSFSIAETAGPVSPSATGWEFMDVLVFFKLSPGDQVIMTGMVGVGSPGTLLPRLDEVAFAVVDDLEDCFNDGNDDDNDGVPNGCDQCPGEDDLVDEDEDGVPDCANDAPPNPDDGGDDEPSPVDGDDGDDDGAPVVPPATFCAFGTLNMLPLTLFGLAALRKHRSRAGS